MEINSQVEYTFPYTYTAPPPPINPSGLETIGRLRSVNQQNSGEDMTLTDEKSTRKNFN
jgi:hypothetical protein